MHDTRVAIIPQRPTRTGRHAFSQIVPAACRARSLYIHIPFCSHKCHYCDFYSIVDTQGRQNTFTQRLKNELSALAPWAAPLETIFIGGGTPSLLALDLWQDLLRHLRSQFELSSPMLEFTVECNPESLTQELADLLASAGVNRISLGAQSFHAAHLKTLERLHNPENVPRALECAHGAGITRTSIDLIYAVPGQTQAEWRSDLDRALALGTTHISCYALTYEPNTAMTARLNRGEFSRADEDLEAQLFDDTISTLRDHGLDRYEVSNFAVRGQECRHNLAYWRQDQWLAAGPSASGHVAGWRYKNTPRLDDYLSVSEEGFAPLAELEAPDADRALRERLMTGLRLREGLPLDLFTERQRAALHATATGFQSGRLLAITEDRVTLTDDGLRIADALTVDFLLALDRANT